jgi:DtxR family Mn-dependent transcriptional regulator
MIMELRLTKLKDGESGIITSIDSNPGRRFGFRRRLEDMGLTPGTIVTVVKSAPLHGPLEILLRGSRLALGRGMASRIYVEVER